MSRVREYRITCDWCGTAHITASNRKDAEAKARQRGWTLGRTTDRCHPCTEWVNDEG